MESVTPINSKPNQEAIELMIHDLMHALKIDQKVPLEHIQDTPKRVAKMLINEVFASLYSDPPEITVFPNNSKDDDQAVVIKDLEVRSMCAHHWMPFYGFATIVYIPDNYVAGLSKFGRIVDYFGRKPQVQEELSKEIIEFLYEKLEPKAIGIYISCTHMCMRHRGLESDHSVTDTLLIKSHSETYGNEVRRILLEILPKR